MMTDSPLATPTIALQCDHPPLALQRRRRTLPRVVVRAPLVRLGARRGLPLQTPYERGARRGVVCGAAYRYIYPTRRGPTRRPGAEPTAMGGTFA